MHAVAIPGEILRYFCEGVSILLVNPSRCNGVGLLQLTTTIVAAGIILLASTALVAQARARRELGLPAEQQDARLLALFARAVSLAGGPAPVLRIARSGRPTIFTLGFLVPAIVIDRGVAAALPDEELIVVLLHEIAHARRRDNLRRIAGGMCALPGSLLVVESFALTATFVDQLFRFDVIPAVILGGLFAAVAALVRPTISSTVEYLREIACDDAAVAAIGDPLVAASALLRVWHLQHDEPAAVVVPFVAGLLGRNSLARRVTRLLDPQYARHARWLSVIRRAGLSPLLLLLVVLVG